MTVDSIVWNRLRQDFVIINQPLADLYDRLSTFRPKLDDVKHSVSRPRPCFDIILPAEPEYDHAKLKNLFLRVIDNKNKIIAHENSKKPQHSELTSTILFLYAKASDCYIMPFANQNDPEKFLESIIEKFAKSYKLISSDEVQSKISPDHKPVILKKIEPPSPFTPKCYASLKPISKKEEFNFGNVFKSKMSSNTLKNESPPNIVIKKIEPPSPDRIANRFTYNSQPQFSRHQQERIVNVTPLEKEADLPAQTVTQKPVSFSFVSKDEAKKIQPIKTDDQTISHIKRYSPSNFKKLYEAVITGQKISKQKPYVKQVMRELKVKVGQISHSNPTQYTKDIIDIIEKFCREAADEEKDALKYHLWILLMEKFSDQFPNQFYHQVNSAISSGHVIKELLMVYPTMEMFFLSLLCKHCPLIFQFACSSPEDYAIIQEYTEMCADEDSLCALRGMGSFLAGICILPNRNTNFSLFLSLNFLPVIIGGTMNNYKECFSAEFLFAVLDVAKNHILQSYGTYGAKLLMSIQKYIESNPSLTNQCSEMNLVCSLRSLFHTKP